jgi:histidyl-tRNA synthetase
VIVGQELADGHVGLKNLMSGEQDTVLLDEVASAVSG